MPVIVTLVTRIFVYFCVLMACGWVVAAPDDFGPTVEVDNSALIRLLNPSYLRKTDATVSINDLLSRDGAAALFHSSGSDNAAFGYSELAYWLNVRLHNPGPATLERVVEADNPLLGHVEFYLQDDTGKLTRLVSSEIINQADHRAPHAQLQLPPNSSRNLLVRLEGNDSLTAPLLLHRPDAFANRQQAKRFALGLLIGAIISLAAYNLMLMLAMRKSTYGWFALHLLTGCLMIVGLNGVGRWNGIASAGGEVHMFYSALSLVMLAMLVYCSSLLQLQRNWRPASYLFAALATLRGGLALLAMLVSSSWLNQLSIALLLPETILITVCCLRMLKRDIATARLLLIGWAILLPSLTAYMLVSFGWLPTNLLASHGPALGLLAAAVIISFASTLRYESLNRRYETATLIASTGLEKGVAERTRTLAQTMAALNDANQQLREANDRDGLTGVYNRRYFDQAIVGMLSKSRIARQPFSALVADIDHFKSVNDSAGHLVGDDCIRLVAGVLRRVVGDGNSVVRYGGEEFVILLPGCNATQAIAIGERIRSAISAETVTTRDKVIRLTISIGIETANANQRISPTALIRNADQALYAAKADGRNRVVHADSLTQPTSAI